MRGCNYNKLKGMKWVSRKLLYNVVLLLSLSFILTYNYVEHLKI
jgi:hypothetical protein